jgi:3-dehydroquinate synthase II
MSKILFYSSPFSPELAAYALECGAHALLVPAADTEDARVLDHVQIMDAESLPIVPLIGTDDLEAVRKYLQSGTQVIVRSDWDVNFVQVLLEENLPVWLETTTHEQVMSASTVLDRGVDMLVITSTDEQFINEAITIALTPPQESIRPAVITRITKLDTAECISFDTFSMFAHGQGALIGTPDFMFLVHADTEPDTAGIPHPYRINAGSKLNYIKLPDSKACPVHTVRGGTRILSVDAYGNARRCIVGQTNKSICPLLLIEAQLDAAHTGSIGLNMAEHICLTAPDGSAVSITQLREGDCILCRIAPETKSFLILDEPGEQGH